jgi:hypothetical protein
MKTFKLVAQSIMLVFFITTIGFSQTKGSISSQDSLKNLQTHSEYKLKFNNDLNLVSPLTPVKIQAAIDEYSDFVLPEFNPMPNGQALSVFKLRNEMNQALQIYRAGQMKNDLGFVGKILGYTGAAAAIGLAAYHVSKYHDKYGIK